MKILFVGDVHGRIKHLYKYVSKVVEIAGPIDWVIQLGDFHAIRDEKDLQHFPVPEKHRKIGDFPEIFKQEKVPVKTFFIGGNHENYRWLSEYENGNEIIDNLFYSGRSGIKKFGDLNIAWISGTYSPKAFQQGAKKVKYQCFTPEDIAKISDSKEKIDILLLHDWPNITQLKENIKLNVNGDINNDVNMLEYSKKRNLGSEKLGEIILKIKPTRVFCGHMHFPLGLLIKSEGSSINFEALNQFDDTRSTLLYDTESGKINYIAFSEFSWLHSDEKKEFEYIYNEIENNCFDNAEKLIFNILEKTSETGKYLCYYGLGTLEFKRLKNSSPLNIDDIDKVKTYLEKTVGIKETADAYIILANICKIKSEYLKQISFQENSDKQELLNVAGQAIKCFQLAASKNPQYYKEAMEALTELKFR